METTMTKPLWYVQAIGVDCGLKKCLAIYQSYHVLDVLEYCFSEEFVSPRIFLSDQAIIVFAIHM